MAVPMFLEMTFFEPQQCSQITNEDHYALNFDRVFISEMGILLYGYECFFPKRNQEYEQQLKLWQRDCTIPEFN